MAEPGLGEGLPVPKAQAGGPGGRKVGGSYKPIDSDPSDKTKNEKCFCKKGGLPLATPGAGSSLGISHVPSSVAQHAIISNYVT